MSRPMTHKRLDPKEARSFCVVALHMAGLPEADADIVADTLMHAECRGVRTHGLVMLPGLVDRLRKGGAKSKPSICILKETACTATMDGDFGLGQVISFNATIWRSRKPMIMGWGASRFGTATPLVPRRIMRCLHCPTT